MKQVEPVSWLIEKFQNSHAVLQGKSGRLVVERGLLPDKAKVGDFLTVDFYFLGDYAKRKKDIAKVVIEELLKVE